jgi:hypothetical protein
MARTKKEPTVKESLTPEPKRTDPTPAEALAMFADRPGLAQVKTTDGVMNRDGSFAA